MPESRPAPLLRFRQLFPACERYIYMNNAGVAPTSTPVRAAIDNWVEQLVLHGILTEAGWESMADGVRRQAAKLLGARQHEIAFVRNTSHGLGLVAEGIDWRPGDEVLVCDEVEFPSNVYPWQHLADRGVKMVSVPARDGGVTLDAVAEAATERSRLLAVSAVQYATGHRTDLAALGDWCRTNEVLFCVDGIQQVGSMPLDVEACGIDYLAADSHKWMLGVPGVGLLYVSDRVVAELRPVVVGWKSTTTPFDFDRVHFELRTDAVKLEEGSPAYMLIAGLGAALRILDDAGSENIAAHIRGLLARAEAGLTAAGFTVSPPPTLRAGILMVEPPAAVAIEAVAAALKAASIVASVRRGRVRLEPHLYNTEAEIDRVVEVMRAVSPS